MVMEKTINFEFFVVSFNGFCIYFLLELLLQEISLIVRNFSHSKESESFITLVYIINTLTVDLLVVHKGRKVAENQLTLKTVAVNCGKI